MTDGDISRREVITVHFFLLGKRQKRQTLVQRNSIVVGFSSPEDGSHPMAVTLPWISAHLPGRRRIFARHILKPNHEGVKGA